MKNSIKRWFFIVFIMGLVFGGGSLWARAITVSSPAAGANWCKGQTYTITWTKTGVMDTNVKIRLYNSTGTAVVSSITNSTPNDGRFDWTISASVVPGNYVVRVRTLDDLVHDDSDVFAVASCPVGHIDIVEPMETGAYAQRDNMDIVWTGSGVVGNGRFEMLPEGGGAPILINASYPLTASPMRYPIPDSLAPGTYRLRISQGDLSATSGRFGILAYRPPGLNLTTPNGGEEYIQGGQINIYWGASHIDGNLRIELLYNNSPIHTISDSSRANAGYFTWRPIPASFGGRKVMLGRHYKIRISSSDGRFVDASDGPFSIRAPAGIWIFSPGAGTSWALGTIQQIRWNAQYLEGYVGEISLSVPNPARPLPDRYQIAEGVDVMAKAYSWRVGDYTMGSLRLRPGSYPGCKIRIIARNGSATKLDESKPFTLVVE